MSENDRKNSFSCGVEKVLSAKFCFHIFKLLAIKMASFVAGIPLSPLLSVKASQPIFGTLPKLNVPTLKDRQDRINVITKATGESSDSSIVKTVQNVWDNSEDRLALIGLGFAGVVALWTSISLVTAIDKLPVFPSVLELVGILFSSWFTYRYLLFKPDREELSRGISKSISDIRGQ